MYLIAALSLPQGVDTAWSAAADELLSLVEIAHAVRDIGCKFDSRRPRDLLAIMQQSEQVVVAKLRHQEPVLDMGCVWWLAHR